MSAGASEVIWAVPLQVVDFVHVFNDTGVVSEQIIFDEFVEPGVALQP